MIGTIPSLLVAEEFYFSALAFLEHIDGDIRLLIICLYRLGYTKKIIPLINRYPELLEIYEIKRIYLSLCKPSSLVFGKSQRTLPEVKDRLEIESLEKYLIGKLYIGEERKKLYSEAFVLDERNFEALMSLHREMLITEDEAHKLILNMKNKDLAVIYKSILYEGGDDFIDISRSIGQNSAFSISKFSTTHFNSYSLAPEENLNFFSPFFGEKIGAKLLKENKKESLFRLGVYMVDSFDSEISYLTLGYHYLVDNNFKEAKKCFYTALKRNENYSIAWLYLGISYSGLKECENAISSFSTAEKHMICSYKPSFYLAYEYHRMNNYEKAYINYENAIKIKNTPEIAYRYAVFLIYYEKFDLAYEMVIDLPYEEIKRLLLAFIYFYTDKLEKAKAILKGDDWRTVAFKGFLYHLNNNYSRAIEMYSEVLVSHDCTVVKDLLAICGSNYTASPAEYASDLFEAMEIKNMTPMPL
ncbi:Anaphase-promoting complex subunit cut9 [Dictyocoela roeselum]|nr:Anaphase-promoting complex subunit cut9 [Dictyocoela roeselum]